MGCHLSELQTSSTKHSLEASEEELFMAGRGQGSQFTPSAPSPLGHQSRCILRFQGGNSEGWCQVRVSIGGSPPEGQETLRKSEPEPRQQWDWHQPLNLCPDSQELNQVPGLRNTVNHMPTFC